MTVYAAKTSVPVAKSRGEIESTLTRYGADQFAYGWEAERAVVQFRAHDRVVRFVLAMPDPSARSITHDGRGSRRGPAQRQAALDQATRQRWRALLLVVKAKLEAVASGITTFEEEFLAQIVLTDGGTVGELLIPQIAQAYDTGLPVSGIRALLGAGS